MNIVYATRRPDCARYGCVERALKAASICRTSLTLTGTLVRHPPKAVVCEHGIYWARYGTKLYWGAINPWFKPRTYLRARRYLRGYESGKDVVLSRIW